MHFAKQENIPTLETARIVWVALHVLPILTMHNKVVKASPLVSIVHQGKVHLQVHLRVITFIVVLIVMLLVAAVLVVYLAKRCQVGVADHVGLESMELHRDVKIALLANIKKQPDSLLAFHVYRASIHHRVRVYALIVLQARTARAQKQVLVHRVLLANTKSNKVQRNARFVRLANTTTNRELVKNHIVYYVDRESIYCKQAQLNVNFAKKAITNLLSQSGHARNVLEASLPPRTVQT
jgi:hypothetical protein